MFGSLTTRPCEGDRAFVVVEGQGGLVEVGEGCGEAKSAQDQSQEAGLGLPPPEETPGRAQQGGEDDARQPCAAQADERHRSSALGIAQNCREASEPFDTLRYSGQASVE